MTGFIEETHPEIYKKGPTAEMYAKLDAAIEAVGGRLPWTGHWPGSLEAATLGWYSRWAEGSGWVRCGPNDEGAGPDLNRLAASAKWDRSARKYVVG